MSPQQEPVPHERLRRAGIEDRTQRRYRCREDSIVHLAVRPSFRSFPALVRDVSANGIGVLLDRPLDIGTVLALQLCGGQPGTSVIRMAHVVHVRPHLPVRNAPWVKKKPLLRSLFSFLSPEARGDRVGEDFIWLIGCRLNPPLTDAELHSLRGSED